MKYYSNPQCLSLAVDKQLNKVLALTFCCNGDLGNSSFQEIYFEFEGQISVRIFCGVDGSSICWDNSNLQPLDMGEYGKLTVLDLSNYNQLWKDLVYKRLEKLYLVSSEIEKCIFAVKFIFGNDLELAIANIGDNLIFQKQLPIEIIEEEKARFIDVKEIIYKE